MHDRTVPVTALLIAARSGDDGAMADLFTRLYDELQSLARHVRRGRADQTLNTTSLVHEAFIRLTPAEIDLQDRQHFMRVAARAMRHVLVDAARRQSAHKRGGGFVAVELDEQAQPAAIDAADIVGLHDALALLERVDERKAQIVEFRVFGGMTVEETAAALGLSVPTIHRDWRMARAWLAQTLGA
ncbi:MAG: ECF-type sigma factor [Rhodothermales bacterium]